MNNAAGLTDAAPQYTVVPARPDVDPELLRVAEDYWRRERDLASGAIKWSTLAVDLCARLGLKSANKLGSALADIALCVAADPCSHCGGARVYPSRTRFAEGWTECRQCQEATEQARQERSRKAHEERLQAEAEWARLGGFLGSLAQAARAVSPAEASILIDQLSSRALAALYTVGASNSAIIGNDVRIGITAGDMADNNAAIRSLVDRHLVILPQSRESGFTETADGYRYDPRRVRMTATPTVVQAVNAKLASRSLGPEAHTLISGLFARETLRFVLAETARFGWDIEFNDPQRDRINEIIVARPSLSLSHCFAAAWAATDSCTATVQAHPAMPATSIASRIVNLLQEKTDRILEGQWTPRPFNEHRDAPIQPLTRHVLTDVYGCDLMHTAWGDVEPAITETPPPHRPTQISNRMESLRDASDAELLAACGGLLPVATLVRLAANQYSTLQQRMSETDAVLVSLGGLTYLSTDRVHLLAAAAVCGHDRPEALFGDDEPT